MGEVVEVGKDNTRLHVGDRVVVPFTIACGRCYFCKEQLWSLCDNSNPNAWMAEKLYGYSGSGLFGYSHMYGGYPGGQAEYLRVPQAQYGPIKVPDGPPDERFVYLSDVLPTAWQAVAYADIPDGGTVTVLGLGPIGDMAARIAHHLGYDVIGVDLVPERLARTAARGIRTVNLAEIDFAVGDAIRSMTDGRGTDSVIDAVGMEAHGSPVAKIAQQVTGLLPDALAKPMMQKAGVDRLAALYSAIDVVRRGGTISLIGVYGGMADPMPMLTLFDKQIQLRMGQANVKRWVDDIMPLLTDDDPLGVDDFASHVVPLDEAPHAYDIFQKKQDNAVKIILKP
jgi:threonine dehydrogenase-like Zn-dependent dehydrogenase